MESTVVLKIITAGDGGVGKTTLLHRYVEGRFETETKMTLGVEFALKTLEMADNVVTLQLWDFSGQEHLRFMLERYVYGANGALFAVDLYNIGRSLRNVEIWWNLLNKHGRIPIILIGTKYDLIEDNLDQIKMYKDTISYIQEKYDFVDYVETSSKTGHNVDHAFNILINQVLDQVVY
jgi:small GTP-binding protein